MATVFRFPADDEIKPSEFAIFVASSPKTLILLALSVIVLKRVFTTAAVSGIAANRVVYLAMEQSTAYNVTALLNELVRLRGMDQQVVFTNGCFDILHVGHVRYLTQARALGDVLVVGLNSDSSIRRIKGEQRPIVSETERKEMLLGLKAVDFVCIFQDETPLELIKLVRPEFLVKGGDWSVDKIIGHEVVAAYGGKTLSLPFVEGCSTTDIIQRVVEAYGS